MKRLWGSCLVGLFLFSATAVTEAKEPKKAVTIGLKGTVTLSGAWALYPMAVKWAEEFRKVYPRVKVEIVAGGAGKGAADVLAGMVDIGMVSREIYPDEAKKGGWWVAVTKDAVVPTVNEKHPAIRTLLVKGVKKETLIDIWIAEKVKDWNEITGDKKTSYPVHLYTRSDACGAAETWAKYLGKKQEDLQGVGVYGDPGIAEAVRKDNLGIGFNNIGYAYDIKSKKPVRGLKILPIDLNGNGRVDPNEDFYRDRDSLTAAIANGKYPSPPARDLYFLCLGKPRKPELVRFINWVLTDGQKYVPETGYINLPDKKLKSELKKLTQTK
ncbi:MAG: substrate-binding domain-containing protein [Candidatus Omnitrophota bacterium]